MNNNNNDDDDDDDVCDCFRFIGSAKILLRDLASGQAKSLPSKNVPLMNEKQKAVGVIIMLLLIIFYYFAHTDKSHVKSVVECSHVLFQATINLLIGYEPPANATSTLNDPPDVDTSQVDAGESQNYLMEDKLLHVNIIFVYFASQEAMMKAMKRRRLWMVEAKVEVCPLPLR